MSKINGNCENVLEKEAEEEMPITERLRRAFWALGLTIFLFLRHFYRAFIKLFVGTKMDCVKGKTWLITGAAGGLGTALSEQVAQRGAKRIILWDVNNEILEKSAEKLRKNYPECQIETQIVDVGDPQQVLRAAEISTKAGTINVLVNNAGIAFISPILKISDEQIEKTFRVNTLAHFWTIRAFLSHWISAGHEPSVSKERHHIITIGSVTGMVGANLCAAYSGSKSAVHTMHESIYQELRSTGLNKKVHMTLICPWYIKNTGMFKKAKLTLGAKALDPKFLAKKIICSVEKSEPFVVIPESLAYVLPLKTVLPIDLGWQLISKVTKSPYVMTKLYKDSIVANNNNENNPKKIESTIEGLPLDNLAVIKKLDPPAA